MSLFWIKVLNITLDILIKSVYLVVIGLVIYLVYYLIFKAYPKFAFLGHTESGFDDFMETYFGDLAKYMIAVQGEKDKSENGSKGDAANAIGAFMDAYKTAFTKPDYNQDLSEIEDFSLNGAVPLHILFMFYLDLKSKDESSFAQCHDILYKQLKAPTKAYLETFYGPENYVDMLPDAWANFVNVYEAFDKMRQATRVAAAAIYEKGLAADNTQATMAVLMLDVMLSKYFDGSELSTTSRDTIIRMYQMRQTGGFSNFRLVKIYIGDYWDYAINQKIKRDIWGQFPEQMRTLADRVLDTITAQPVLDWFTSLPSRLAGTDKEGFKNRHPEAAKAANDAFEAFSISPYSRDVNETFVDQLLKIAKTFVEMLKVITAIVDVIADPVAFIKFLIGTIIAIILYIIYFILVNIQIAVAIAYIWAVCSAIAGTVYWGVQVLVFAVFYCILSVIDMPLGGFIMRSLRCENLPDAWSRVSNWHNGNWYERTFFCSYQCRQGFKPSTLLPISMCVSQDTDEPIYAPQQVIYNTFKNNEFVNSVGAKLVYSHSVDAAYFASKPETQAKMWKAVFEARQTYIQGCRNGSSGTSGYSDYDPLIKQMCSYMMANNAFDDDKVCKGLCENLYCSDTDAAKNPLCEVKQETGIDSEQAQPKDIVRKILFTVICIIVVFLALYYLLRSENEKSIFGKIASLKTQLL